MTRNLYEYLSILCFYKLLKYNNLTFPYKNRQFIYVTFIYKYSSKYQ